MRKMPCWCRPSTPGLAAVALDRLLGDPGLAKRLGAAAQTRSKDLTWDRRAEKIAAFLEARTCAAPSAKAVQRSLYSSTVRPISAAMTGADHAPTAAGK